MREMISHIGDILEILDIVLAGILIIGIIYARIILGNKEIEN